MPSPLRVDPDRLRASAAAQHDVSAFVGGLAIGQSMATAGAGMAGLQSEAACRLAANLFDTAAGVVSQELTTHAKNLTTAAEHYQRADEELGRRLRQIAEGRA
jgi:Excreted virulence factor EspC, type VII ESX diderm